MDGAEIANRQCSSETAFDAAAFLGESFASPNHTRDTMHPGRPQSISYAEPSASSNEALRMMARRSFSDTFAHHYQALPFAIFLREAYGPGGGMDRDLTDPTIRWLVGFCRHSRSAMRS